MAQLPCIGLSWPLTKNPPVGSGNRHLLSLWCNMVHLKMMGFQIQKLLFPGCHFQVNHVELWEGVTTKIPQRIASLDIQRAWWERIWTSKTYRSNHRSPQFRCLDPPNLSVDCQRMSRIINSATPKDSGDMDWTDHDLWLGWLAKIKNKTITSWWLNQPIWKNISQNGNLPQIGMNIKNLWNHHPDNLYAANWWN